MLLVKLMRVLLLLFLLYEMGSEPTRETFRKSLTIHWLSDSTDTVVSRRQKTRVNSIYSMHPHRRQMAHRLATRPHRQS
ncbi:hypothetical protein K457DRAFT_1836764 [Linnemannia elongata AG-77]|uniref:Secreted protein n=1 Tax=Linnemannia elongata AG-77 TaxID=1314771 RepID=A0A197JHW1_9FUNG|nr:hypothetical protein K457DRAFT_1836764 [Linnemannia elongata AG-77]